LPERVADVDWILRNFRRRGPELGALVCYLRENGPIAYGADMLGGDPRARAAAMLSSGLTWYWQTSSTASPRDAAREWTELTHWSLAALLADLAAGHEGLSSRVLLIAIDGQDAPSDVTDRRVAAWMRGFGAAATGPLHAVVTRPAPGGDLLFVAQQPPESIRTLLQAWGINRDKAERRAYARLRGQSLEDLTAGVGS
jgi:hypothetical protein